MRGMTPTRWCLTFFAIFLIAALLLFLFDSVTGRGFLWLHSVMPMLFLLAGLMLPMAAAARAWEQRRLPAMMILSMGVIGAGGLIWIGILQDVAGLAMSDDAPFAAGLLTTIGVGGGFTGLLLVPQLPSATARMVRGFSVAAMVLLTLQVAAWVGISWCITDTAGWGSYWSNEFHEDMARGAGVLAVLAAALAVATWVLSHTRSLLGEDEVQERVPFFFACPRCGERQTGETGGDVCDACGLSITVVVL